MTDQTKSNANQANQHDWLVECEIASAREAAMEMADLYARLYVQDNH
jgi:hypothetical protein